MAESLLESGLQWLIHRKSPVQEKLLKKSLKEILFKSFLLADRIQGAGPNKQSDASWLFFVQKTSFTLPKLLYLRPFFSPATADEVRGGLSLPF